MNSSNLFGGKQQIPTTSTTPAMVQLPSMRSSPTLVSLDVVWEPKLGSLAKEDVFCLTENNSCLLDRVFLGVFRVFSPYDLWIGSLVKHEFLFSHILGLQTFKLISYF